EGFGLEDTHSVVNSLRWGPDGWLYAAQGSTVTGNVRRYGTDEPIVHSMGQQIWRYHPERRRYEVFAEGGGNAFGVEIDAKGRIFSGHNGGDTRGFHYVQGGYCRKGFAKHGALSNPYAFGYFEPMVHHQVPRFTHDFVIYAGGSLPTSYHGKLFGVEPLQGQVVESEFTSDRSSFKTRDLSRPLKTDDPWFRPVDIVVGPDGAIYVADFCEQRIDHSSHYASRVDRTSGRIYRLTAKEVSTVRSFDLSKLTSRELMEWLSHDNKWDRQTALRVLADRRDSAIVPHLRSLIEAHSGQLALEALWGLHASGGLDEAVTLETLDHADPYVRLWSARLACDEGTRVTAPVARKLAALARRESHVEVRSQLACSARRLPAEQLFPILRGLLRHADDVNDPHIPLLLWWALESKAETDREAVLGFVSEEELWTLPLVEEHLVERVMRRYAAAGSRVDLAACTQLLRLAPSPHHVQLLMQGFEKAVKVRPLAAWPEDLVTTILERDSGSLALRVRQGDQEAVRKALQVIADEEALVDERLRYVGVFAEVDQSSCVPVLLSVLKNSESEVLRSATLTTLSYYREPAIATGVLDLYDDLPDNLYEPAHHLLASRPTWSLELLRKVNRGEIESTALPRTLLRRILLHPDPEIATLVSKHWGEVEGSTTEAMRTRVEQLSETIAKASGNPYEGEVLFAKRCGKCHTLFGNGGDVGPDLTSYQRDDLERLLVSVVNPSAEIREGYENYAVVTTDGRILNGFLADRDEQVVIVRDLEGRNAVVPQTAIVELQALERSVMPEGTLEKLTEEQIQHLFAYLRSSQPLP
ncbi:MAG: dehydrogenase, partial [Planctomycetaceae bacterium]|nr:dehydrogenase [Planctomycetaceae bacterium]